MKQVCGLNSTLGADGPAFEEVARKRALQAEATGKPVEDRGAAA